MGARILFRDSQGRDGQVDLSPAAPLYVGRALDCAVRTDDAMVSRKHSMIRLESGRFYVEDLGSSNGTHVNDVRVTKQVLAHNDVVRCGSLWLRYVEDGPLAVAPQAAAGAAAPGGGRIKGGTQRLDPAPYEAAAAAARAAAPAGQGLVGAGAAAANAAPRAGYQPPSRQGGGSTMGLGGAGTPRSNASTEPAPLFGGPPAMPRTDSGEVSGDLSGEFMTPAPANPKVVDEDSVVVDLSAGEAARLRKDLDDARAALEKMQVTHDREVADSKRLRAEIVTHKDRVEELRRVLAERDEVIEAHGRVADELREETRQVKDALAAARTQSAEMSDLVAARERQLARTHEDIGQLRREIEERDRKLVELSRSKDDGWRKLNEQLGEIEHLREVINQQERMLEERRVGLISQDELIKELRSKEERNLRDSAHLKAERDGIKNEAGRLQAQVGAIDEENRRLTGLLTEQRGRRAGQEADHEAAAHTAAVSAEIKTLRIALKTVESERDHLRELADRSEQEVDELRERVAALEVDLREAVDDRERASAGKSVSDDAMTRAELARHKAAEELMAAQKAREEAQRASDELRRELDRARRQVNDLEDQTSTADAPSEAVVERNLVLERRLTEANDSLARLEADLRAARAELEAARKEPARGRTPDGDESTAIVEAGANPAAIKDRAIEVHDDINDVLSELRSNALILQQEFSKDGPARSPASFRIMVDAIEAVLGHAEEAKGVLRRLRELVEFGGG